jgi:hypothetical protein
MKSPVTRSLVYALALASASGALFLNDDIILLGQAKLTGAEARVGRPATPMSYAGVARRTTRRAAVVGGAAAAGAAGAYYGSGCYQATNAYGQIVTQCR